MKLRRKEKKEVPFHIGGTGETGKIGLIGETGETGKKKS